MENETVHGVEITASSGNVFADLGLADPDERQLKAQLAFQIQRFIEQKGWTQAQAAAVIGLVQPKVSLLLRGQLAGFSVQRLLTILQRLGHDVEVRISAEEHAPEEARLRVQVC